MSFNCGDIQNVFIERMHHLLKPKGIAAIVMPSALLSNSEASDIKTREILLHNFYIRCIASFGGKTFGKTSTNTIILFLEHFDFPPQKAKLLKDSATAIVNGENLEDWSDSNLFNEYLKTIDTTKESYLQFVSKTESLFENSFAPYFKEYETAFRSQTGTKKALEKIVETERKENANQPLKKNEKSSDEQKQMLSNEFFDWVKEIEENKILVFALTYQQHTLIITAPTDTNEQKRFLGYTSSERRGNEGLKETDGLLTNISDRNDEQKLAWFVRKAFDGEQCKNDELEKYAKFVPTASMLDYSKPSFDLQIKLSVDKKVEIESKYPTVRLGVVAEIIRGVSYDKQSQVSHETNNVVLTADNITLDGRLEIVKKVFVSDSISFDSSKQLKENDCFMCFSSGSKQHVGKVAFIPSSLPFYAGGFMGILRVKGDGILPRYLFESLNNDTVREIVRSKSSGSNIQNLSKSIGEVKIPFPPIEIQQQIVSECEKVDEEYNRSRESIEDYKKKIVEVLYNVRGERKKLREIAPYTTTRIAYADTKAENYITTDNLLQNCEGMKTYDGVPTVDSVIGYQKGDILVSNIRPYLKKIWYADRDGGCSPDVLVFRTIDGIDSRYVYYSLKQEKFFDFMMQGTKGMKMPRGDKYSIPDFEIVIPKDQQAIVSEIEAYEQKISEAKAVMEGCAERKKQILEKWLK